MSQLKTTPTKRSVDEFLSQIENPQQRHDCETLNKLFESVTGCKGVIWGKDIIGFDSYQYKNTQGTHSWLLTGFAPRTNSISLYIMLGLDNYQEELKTLGKTKQAKSCLTIKKLSDIDQELLYSFLQKTTHDMRQVYGSAVL